MSELGDALRELEAATQRVKDAASHTLSDVAAKVNEVVGEFDASAEGDVVAVFVTNKPFRIDYL